jgi:hypothetical protein
MGAGSSKVAFEHLIPKASAFFDPSKKLFSIFNV